MRFFKLYSFESIISFFIILQLILTVLHTKNNLKPSNMLDLKLCYILSFFVAICVGSTYIIHPDNTTFIADFLGHHLRCLQDVICER